MSTKYYTKCGVNKTPSNSDDFSTIRRLSNFADDGIYFGDLKSPEGEILPALIPIQQTGGLCFLSTRNNEKDVHNCMQAIALRLLMALPNGCCQIAAYDPRGFGHNTNMLTSFDRDMVKMVESPKELMSELNELQGRIKNNIRSMGNRETLVEYNDYHREDPIPYLFFFWFDCPRPSEISNEALSVLSNILHTGGRYGVYVVTNIDTSYYEDKSDSIIGAYRPLLRELALVYEAEGRYFVKNVPNEELFNGRLTLSISSVLPTTHQLEKMTQSCKVEKKAVSLNGQLEERRMWKGDCSAALRVPIGIVQETSNDEVKRGDTMFFEAGGTNSHCLVGGSTGYGKSVLLHNIICNSAWMYSPDRLEFILLDFKEGTEFNCYRDLPHLKVLSMQSAREYALSVFDYIEGEFERRGVLFRDYGVQNLKEYNDCRPQKVLPRLVVVIDEFQKMLVRGSVNAITERINNILRQGRSFGINLILCTQSIVGYDCGNLLGNIGIRIMFHLNNISDSYIMLHQDNTVPFDNLKDVGEIVYNEQGGVRSGNIRSMVANLDNVQRSNMISQIVTKAKSEQKGVKKKYVYDGTTEANINNNPDIVNTSDNKECKIYIGEPMALLEEHINFKLRRRNGSNVLIAGQPKGLQAISLIRHAVKQICNQATEGGQLFLCDPTDELRTNYELQKGVTYCDYDVTKQTIMELHQVLEKRQNDKILDAPRIVLVLYDLGGFRFLRKQGYPMPESLKMLQALVCDGARYGIHVIVYVQRYEDFEASFDNSGLFDVRIQLAGGNGHRIFGVMDSNVERLDENTPNIAMIKIGQDLQKTKLYNIKETKQ